MSASSNSDRLKGQQLAVEFANGTREFFTISDATPGDAPGSVGLTVEGSPHLNYTYSPHRLDIEANDLPQVRQFRASWVDRSCHAECTIGPNADHHGTMEYRCMDESGHGLPFPGEPSTVIDLGDYSMHVFDEDAQREYDETGHWCNYCDNMTDHLSSGHPEPKPGRPVDPNVLALNIMAAKVARIRDEIAGWEDDDSEHSSAWSLAADLIERILDGEG